jgi:hypothetical protein
MTYCIENFTEYDLTISMKHAAKKKQKSEWRKKHEKIKYKENTSLGPLGSSPIPFKLTS